MVNALLSKRKNTVVAVIGVAVAAMVMGGATVPAAAAGPDPQVAAALQHIGDGTWTESDLALIKTKAPEIADEVLDPHPAAVTTGYQPAGPYTGPIIGPQPGPGEDASVDDEVSEPALTDEEAAQPLPGEVVNVPGDEGMSARSANATLYWKWVTVTYTHKSLLGSTIYKYHHKVHFEYGGGKVRAWGARSDDVTNEQDVVVIHGRTKNTKSSVPATAATSYMKRHISLTVPLYGEYAQLYPWVKIKVKGTGGYSYSGSSG